MNKLVKLTTPNQVKGFYCSDSDLNSFLLEDAYNFSKELLAVTYLLEAEADDKVIAYFSLLNDKVDLDDTSNRDRNRFNRSIPNAKRYNSYPSVKIGRLAVASEFSGRSYGSKILDLVKGMFAINNKTGCRYITVDAYAVAIPFYEKNGFKFLSVDDEGEDTRLMYYDLKNLSDLR